MAWQLRHFRHPWMRPHPFDKFYGTSTSGIIPPLLIAPNADLRQNIKPYVGCQPSCTHQALNQIPEINRFSFIDLGCGKGRALIIAKEFPFRAITGVELSPDLVQAAQKNIHVVTSNWPDTRKIQINQGDATNWRFKDENFVLFLFHPFGVMVIAYSRMSISRFRLRFKILKTSSEIVNQN